MDSAKTAAELAAVFEESAAVSTMLDQFDANKDGVLSMPEWLEWVKAQEAKSAGGTRLMLQKYSTALGGLADLNELKAKQAAGSALPTAYGPAVTERPDALTA